MLGHPKSNLVWISEIKRQEKVNAESLLTSPFLIYYSFLTTYKYFSLDIVSHHKRWRYLEKGSNSPCWIISEKSAKIPNTPKVFRWKYFLQKGVGGVPPILAKTVLLALLTLLDPAYFDPFKTGGIFFNAKTLFCRSCGWSFSRGQSGRLSLNRGEGVPYNSAKLPTLQNILEISNYRMHWNTLRNF